VIQSLANMKRYKQKIEELAKEFHSVYQQEAKRQGDIRYPDDYEELPENIKEFDRALARHILKIKSLNA